jgi:methylmalonyl-CoA mutase N-terminal domain/subunit
MDKITAMGGSVSAIEQGFMQDEIARSAFEYQRNIESGQKIIVGVNKFTVDKETPVPGFKIDDSIRQLQSAALATLRTNRNHSAVEQCLNAIKSAATGSANLMPLVVEAVEAYCTLGEIADVLRQVYGEHR